MYALDDSWIDLLTCSRVRMGTNDSCFNRAMGFPIINSTEETLSNIYKYIYRVVGNWQIFINLLR